MSPLTIQLQPIYANTKELKERYVLVQPGPAELYTGVLDSDNIKPSPVPTLWIPRPLSTQDLEYSGQPPIIIHFQGGGFVTATDPIKNQHLPCQNLWC